ncbi:3D domain-containing protein [Sediminicola sp. YIK13]|uniref:3D domain-containing protein n=1 Tax=Sediminicola sp. YIK13 TaxID=1453352 RepID=UPI000781F7F6|nr:3D domain-containing protein [Sediminicola sp. YIK13]
MQKSTRKTFLLAITSISIVLTLHFSSCTPKKKVYAEVLVWDSIRVTATAYNSLPSQTTALHSNITAWGDTLRPGMKCIAVSRDLIKMGLKHNTMVRIDTSSQIYLVKDKMHTRWRKKIDIYMGVDRAKAIEWGRKKVQLYYVVKKDSILVVD